jgi:2-C-methyl-D-erythritol 2,4-cyclodiphosphate synthase
VPSDIGIQASTSEELGFVGREEGMVAWAIAAIEKI